MAHIRLVFVLQANELEIRGVKYKTMNWHNECNILVNELNEYNHNICKMSTESLFCDPLRMG